MRSSPPPQSTVMPMSLRLSLLAAATTALLAACASTPAASPDVPPEVAQAFGDSRPVGYLPADAVPDSKALSLPPPAAGSAAYALDLAVAEQALAMRGTPRFAQATVDAELRFPAGADQFACALGAPISAEHTPVLYRLLERVRIDASAATKGAKVHYQRPRPFMVNGQPTCTPEAEQPLRNSGSYPSGHTSIGWTWALVLSELAPERGSALIERGRNYGYSRLVCNVHWYSDIKQGQFMGSATVAALHANAEFNRDLALARAELAKVRAQNLPLPRDCAAEQAVLATEPSEAF